LTLLLTGFACAGQTEPETGGPVFDEASINNVWHQLKLRGVVNEDERRTHFVVESFALP
jgi:hypothetical protein